VRAIIVAAGMGRRLAPHTDDRPKCLVEIGGKSILQRQVDAYRRAGVTRIAVVRGYMAERVIIDGAGVDYFENTDYKKNNILVSLFHAESVMEGGFLFSYSDIVFRPEVVRTLVEAPADYGLVVDRRWDEAYVGRTLHPESEAELASVAGGPDGRKIVRAVGKRVVPRDEAHGEFIGLARFSARAAERMRAAYHAVRARGEGAPFGTASRFEVAYLTDLLNHLIAEGEVMHSVDIDGGWREIDTPQDLERARAIVDW
jgi:L-glutamine-phosphate cytidylyltransferase